MSLRFENKVAIVTGGGKGIGREIVLRLAAEGADVVIADMDAKSAEQVSLEVKQIGQRALPYPIDVTQVEKIQEMVDDVTREFGHIDILINNAGLLKSTPLLEITPQEWHRVIEVNQTSVFFCIQKVARQMIAQIPPEVRNNDRASRSFGKIVNISSVAGRSGRVMAAHYAAAKAAVISITRSAALALARYNINVNAIAPSAVDTDLWKQIDVERQKLGIPPGQTKANYTEQIPLKRFGTCADMAYTVLFLCSSETDYVTGQTWHVDGGAEMH